MTIKKMYKQPSLPVKILQQYHSLFYALGQLGDPVWNDRIQTAAVHYNPQTKRMAWDINPKFWNMLNENERAFLVCHEALHVLLDHDSRIKRLLGNSRDQKTLAELNICVDVAVNEQLLRSYGFRKNELPTLKEFMADADFLIDTVKEDKMVEVLNKYQEFLDIEDSGESLNELISMGNLEFFRDLMLSSSSSSKKNKDGSFSMTSESGSSGNNGDNAKKGKKDDSEKKEDKEDKEEGNDGEKEEDDDEKEDGEGENEDESEEEDSGEDDEGDGNGDSEEDDEEDDENNDEDQPREVRTLDVHNSEAQEGDGKGSDLADIMDGLADSIQELDMHPDQKEEALEELKEIARGIGVELGAGFSVPRPKYKPKPKWETIIKRWISKTIDEYARTDDNWFGDKRNMSWLAQLSFVRDSGMMLPGEDRESTDIHKIPVLLLLDTSGSCYHYAARFIQAALSFPKEYFDVEVWGFTTQVYKIDYTKKDVKLRTGGTRFDILENLFQEKVRQGKKPHCVFVITDGMGTHVVPQFPERWHWFMTDLTKTRYGTNEPLPFKDQIPSYVRHLFDKSKFYDLDDFE